VRKVAVKCRQRRRTRRCAWFGTHFGSDLLLSGVVRACWERWRACRAKSAMCGEARHWSFPEQRVLTELHKVESARRSSLSSVFVGMPLPSAVLSCMQKYTCLWISLGVSAPFSRITRSAINIRGRRHAIDKEHLAATNCCHEKQNMGMPRLRHRADFVLSSFLSPMSLRKSVRSC
jgi:hypothetical protein